METIILKHNYVLLPAYWQGRTAFLEGKPREINPYAAEPTQQTDSLAWLVGWDDEAEEARSFQCIHDWEPDDAGEYCLICRVRKNPQNANEPSFPVPPCVHDWLPDDDGEYCLLCSVRKGPHNANEPSFPAWPQDATIDEEKDSDP